MITRRSFLLGSAVVPASMLSSCRQRQAFSGYAFVANQEGQAVAAVDLSVFAVAKHIPVDGNPTAVIANPMSSRIYTLTPANGKVHEIATEKLAVVRSATTARQAVSVRITADGKTIYVLCRDPKRLAALSTDSFRTEWNLALPSEPLDFDLSADGKWIAISYGSADFLQLVDLSSQRPGVKIGLGGNGGIVRFQSDSSQLIAANLSDRILNVYQTAGGRLVVKLPLPLRPDRFCFNADGGQLFITGEGMDAVVIVYPYFTPQIGETVLSGHAPGAMAVTANFIFVANSGSGDVSILDASSKRVVAVAPTGTEPSFIAITPDDQYALVLNAGSGDMGVILIPSITRSRARTAALFTMIPVGSKPVSAAVVQI